MVRDEVKVHKNTKKKERGQYPAILTKQAWSIMDLLYGQNFTQSTSISSNTPADVSARDFRGKLIFVYLTLSDACNNQCFINCFIM